MQPHETTHPYRKLKNTIERSLSSPETPPPQTCILLLNTHFPTSVLLKAPQKMYGGVLRDDLHVQEN